MNDSRNIGATIACCIVLVGFIVVCLLMITHSVPDSPSLQILVGGLNTMAAGALYYFTGSTASSKAKDRTIADVATAKDK